MVSPATSDTSGDRSEPGQPDALAGGAPLNQRAQRGDVARLDQIERITKQIAHLIKASDRLAAAPIDDGTALAAMDTINFEIELLTQERNVLQVEEDLDLAQALAVAQQRSALVESILRLPDAAVPEALWSLFEEVDGDRIAFAEALGLDPAHPDVVFLIDLVHNSIGDRQ